MLGGQVTVVSSIVREQRALGPKLGVQALCGKGLDLAEIPALTPETPPVYWELTEPLALSFGKVEPTSQPRPVPGPLLRAFC